MKLAQKSIIDFKAMYEQIKRSINTSENEIHLINVKKCWFERIKSEFDNPIYDHSKKILSKYWNDKLKQIKTSK